MSQLIACPSCERHVRVGEVVDQIDKIHRLDIIRKPQRGEVLPFVRAVHPVDDQDIFIPQLIQPPNDRTPEKPGPAGHENAIHGPSA